MTNIHEEVENGLFLAAANIDEFKQHLESLKAEGLGPLARDMVLTNSKLCRGCKVPRKRCKLKATIKGILLLPDFDFEAAAAEIRDNGLISSN